MSGTSSSACRELLDTAPRQANSRAHRAPRMAPHVIEKAGHGGGESGALLRGASPSPDRCEGKPSDDGPSASRMPRERPVLRIPSGRTGAWLVTWFVQQREGTRIWVQIADPGVESSGDGRRRGVTCQSFMEENMRALIVHTKTIKARAARARRASPRRCAFRWCN